MADLQNLSVLELLNLHKEVVRLLTSRRTELESQLAQIRRFGAAGAKKRENSHLRELPSTKQPFKAVAKYRHPKTGEEWSGRGRMARWLALEIAAGRSKDSFEV